MRKLRLLRRLFALVVLVFLSASLTPTASKAQSSSDVKTTFEMGEQFADMAGQPELAAAAGEAEKLLEAFGIMGSDQDPQQATNAALKQLGAQVATAEARLKAQQQAINKFAAFMTFSTNQGLINQAHDQEQFVMAQQVQLAPPAASSDVNCERYRRSQGCAPPPPAVTPEQASGIVKLAFSYADDIVDRQSAYWMGADLARETTPNPSDPQHPITTPNSVYAFKPYPALEVYLHALSLAVLGMEVESQGNYPSIVRKYGARGGELDKHIAFLTLLENGAPEKSWPDQGIVSLPHTLVNQVRCQEVTSSQYPDSSGQCHAKIVCQDAIDRTTVALPKTDTWYQGDRNSFCQGNPAVTNLHSDELEFARAKYHTDAIEAMRGLLIKVKETGTAHSAGSQPAGSLGTSPADASQLVLYGVGRLGEVSWYEKDGLNGAWSGPVVVAQGWRNLTALVPAGGSDFFSVNSFGFLNVVTLGGSSKAVGAAVQLGSGWNAYQSVFGGGDGVLYAIAKDGTLLWFRRGPGGSLQGPVTVGSGWGGFTRVFSAGQGVIYGVKPDGSLIWYRHTDYLTGVSGGVAGRMEARAGQAQAHWEGPMTVGSGWNVFSSLVPAGGGVVLAVRPDGALLWYKHEGYLSGSSRPGIPRPGGVAQPLPHWNGPVVIGSGWNQFTQVSATLANSQGSNIR